MRNAGETSLVFFISIDLCISVNRESPILFGGIASYFDEIWYPYEIVSSGRFQKLLLSYSGSIVNS